ncbi:MAG: YfhO family protein [Vicinamibacterales bacterium]
MAARRFRSALIQMSSVPSLQRPSSGRASSRLYPHLCHAAAVAAYVLLFSWVHGESLVGDVYLVASDLYEYFLPIFLSPWATWSTYEFAGIPVFTDPNESYAPLHLLMQMAGTWGAYVVAAHLLGAGGTYAYVFVLTRSAGPAFVAGLAFGLSEAMIERLAHLSTLHTIGWMPFLFVAIERVIATRRSAWVAAGAFVVANTILAGHPQPAMYACLTAVAYALVAGRARRLDRRYYVQAASIFVLGGLLAAVKLVPFVEVTGHMARDVVNFGQFVSRSLTPAEMWSALFPTILKDGREAPTYVGLAILVFAGVAATRAGRDWRVAFWIVAAIVGVLFGLGDHTPFARLAYDYLPLYDKFRVGPRHLMISSFGAAVLAGLGMHAIALQQASRRTLWGVLALVGAIMLAGLAYVGSQPSSLRFEVRSPIPWTQYGAPALVDDTLWTQAALAAATIGAAIVFAAGRGRAPATALVAAVVTLDLLNAQPFDLTARGLRTDMMPVAMARPSVHAERLRDELAPLRQRMLAAGGTHLDGVVPAAWARLWQIPIAGGYGPMLLARHSLLSTMGRNGAVRHEVFSAADQSLDLLAVRHMLVDPAEIVPQGTVDAAGITWEREPLEFPIGRADCGHSYPRSMRLWLPPDVEIAAVHLTAHLRCAEHMAQGTPIATLSLADADGTRHERVLRAGVDVADAALSDPAVLARARHQPAPAGDPLAPATGRSLVTLTLPDATRARFLEVSTPPFEGWLMIGRLTVVDRQGRALPQSAAQLFLRDTDRWREVRRFRTSRRSDRGKDDDARGEREYIQFENLQAMPRAWVVPSLAVLTEYDIAGAVRSGRLPDGRVFNPAELALVEETDDRPPSTRFPPTPSAVRIDEVRNGRAVVRATSPGGGFLVLSETYYPGWTASVDGRAVPVYRANLSLQGVVLPPGSHDVVFELSPRSLYAGAALSLAAIVAIAAMLRR